MELLKPVVNLSHSTTVYRRVSKLRPAGQIRPAQAFHPALKAVSSIMKNIFRKNLLIWQSLTYPETNALRKLSGPRTVV